MPKKADAKRQLTVRMPWELAQRLEVTAMRAPGEDTSGLINRIIDRHLTLVEKYGEDVAMGVIEKFSK